MNTKIAPTLQRAVDAAAYLEAAVEALGRIAQGHVTGNRDGFNAALVDALGNVAAAQDAVCDVERAALAVERSAQTVPS